MATVGGTKVALVPVPGVTVPPVADQTSDVSVVPVMVATRYAVSVVWIVAVAGDTVTVTVGGSGGGGGGSTVMTEVPDTVPTVAVTVKVVVVPMEGAV